MRFHWKIYITHRKKCSPPVNSTQVRLNICKYNSLATSLSPVDPKGDILVQGWRTYGTRQKFSARHGSRNDFFSEFIKISNCFS